MRAYISDSLYKAAPAMQCNKAQLIAGCASSSATTILKSSLAPIIVRNLASVKSFFDQKAKKFEKGKSFRPGAILSAIATGVKKFLRGCAN